MSTNEIQIILNGEKKTVTTQTLADLLEVEKVKTQMVTIKLKRAEEDQILKPDQYSMPLENGDQIDLLFFMGGGN